MVIIVIGYGHRLTSGAFRIRRLVAGQQHESRERPISTTWAQEGLQEGIFVEYIQWQRSYVCNIIDNNQHVEYIEL